MSDESEKIINDGNPMTRGFVDENKAAFSKFPFLRAKDIPLDIFYQFMESIGVRKEEAENLEHINIDIEWRNSGLVKLRMDRFSAAPALSHS